MLIAVKKCISSFHITTSFNIEATFVCVTSSCTKTIIGVCYRPPNYTGMFCHELHSLLLEINERYLRSHVLVYGDFNFPNIDWFSLTTSGSSEARDFLDLCLNHNFTQVVDKPTREDNILDLILTTSPDLVTSISQSKGFSDHNLLTVELSLPIHYRNPSSKMIKDYSKANFDAMNSNLSAYLPLYTASFYSRTIEQNWLLFKNKLNNLVDLFVPSVHIRSDDCNPWYNKALRSLNNKKKRLFRRARHLDCDAAWDAYFLCLKTYTRNLRLAKHKFFFEDLFGILRNNPKKFWKIISPNSRSSSIQLTDEDGSPISEADCATVLNDYFSSVFTLEDADVPILAALPYESMEPIEISCAGIAKLLDNLKLTSSGGPDDITPKILHYTKAISSEFLYLIFSQSLSQGCLPSDWKLGKVVPVFEPERPLWVFSSLGPFQ